MSAETTPKYERRYDIDWLRIIAVFLVFIYHCSRFFDLNDWHVKNNELDLTKRIYQQGEFHEIMKNGLNIEEISLYEVQNLQELTKLICESSKIACFRFIP